MTLDEAIKRAEEVAEMKKTLSEESELQGCSMYAIRRGKSAEEHRQLAEWLKELKTYKEQEPCEDAVSRESVLAMSEYVGEMSTHENPYAKPEEVVRVKDIMALPPATPAQRWIPVSERLPEKSMRCLVAVGRFNFTEIATYSDLMGIIDHEIFYQGEVGHDNFENITQYVKAWMPAPKAYKAESEDKN